MTTTPQQLQEMQTRLERNRKRQVDATKALPSEVLAKPTKAERGAERELHVQFENWCRLNDLVVIHSRMDRATTTEKGVPDFAVFAFERYCFVELKAHPNPEKHLSKAQQNWIAKAAFRGIKVAVVNSVESAISYTKSELNL